jgi:hypothetical protein
MHRGLFALVLLVLVACGGAPAAAPTGQAVLDAFKAAGIEVTDPTPGTREADTPLPNSYKEHIEFTIPSLGDKGGQLFVCDTKQNCDALYAYFDALKGLGGPYYYQSDGGRIVVQLNSGLAADEAAKFAAAIKALP